MPLSCNERVPPRGSLLELWMTILRSGEYQRVDVMTIGCALPILSAGIVIVV